jgi:O-antigen/teichoic acid export membrane protein
LAACTGLGTMAVVAGLALIGLPPEKRQLLPLCLLASCMLPWEQLRLSLMAVDHGSANFRRYNITALAGAGAFPAILAILFVTGGASVPLIVVLSVLAPIVALAIRFAFRERDATPRGEPVPMRGVVREGLPYALADLSSHLFSRLDMFLVLWLMSFTVQGYFAAAVSAGHLMVVTPNALALFSFNSGARRRVTGSRQLLATGAAVVLFQAATALAFAVVLGPLVVIVFGNRFEGAIPLALALLPAYAVFGVSRVAVGYLRGRSKSAVEVRSRILGAVLMVVVVFLLFDRYQEYSIPIGALCGNLASALYIAIGVAHDVRRESGLSLESELEG